MRTERGQKLEAQLVSADEAAIEQLMSLGNFGRWEVIEALLAVDRNVEQAALHLTGEPMAHLGECGFVRDRPGRSLDDVVVPRARHGRGRGRGRGY